MRNKNNKHLGIEIDPELHYKLHYISKYYGRSANGQILYLIRQEIKAFEQSEGQIEMPIQNDNKYKRRFNTVVFVLRTIRLWKVPFLKVFGVQGRFFKSTPASPLTDNCSACRARCGKRVRFRRIRTRLQGTACF